MWTLCELICVQCSPNLCPLLHYHKFYVGNAGVKEINAMASSTRLALGLRHEQDDDRAAPLRDWFAELVPKARAKCQARLEMLAQLGHELRRPVADYLRDDIHELRAKHLNVNYRMLYFFHGQTAVVVSHGFTKQQAKVPDREIELAIRRKKAFEANPTRHSFEGEVT